MIGFGCLESPCARFFKKYGSFVATHPLPFIIGPILFTALLSTGLLYLKSAEDAVYLFTPTDAPSKTERQIIHDLWPVNEHNYIPGRGVIMSREAQVAVLARDNGNILEKEYAEAIHRLDLYIQNRIVKYYCENRINLHQELAEIFYAKQFEQVHHHNKSYIYKDLCLKYRETGCIGNSHIQTVSELYAHGVNITYPYFRIGKRGGYIGSALGGVNVGKGDDGSYIVTQARSWLLLYQMKFYPSNVSYISGLWEQEFRQHLERYPKDPYISITFFHSQTLSDELTRNAESLVPKFVLSFCMLVTFSVCCSIVTIEKTFYIDWVLSKPILSILGVVNAGMAIASTVGGLTMIGAQYTDIIAVMPFLVVAVGTDNMFLMVASLRRTNRAFPVHQRIGECMSEAAVSILLTALTDVFSFAVGTITTIPAVQLFCIYTGCAIGLTFIYQITFFCALLSLSTEWESKGLHCLLHKPTVPDKLHNTSSYFDRILWLGSRPHPQINHKGNVAQSKATRFFQQVFAPLLMHPISRVMIFMWYIIYMGFAIYGCTQLREGLEPVNLLVDDSYATPHYRVLEKYFWKYGASVQIVVSKPPDMANEKNRDIMKQMMRDFSQTSHSMGTESIQSWMVEMDHFYKNNIYTTENYLPIAAQFFYEMRNDPWPEDVKWKRKRSGEYYISAFRFLVGMKSISSTTEQQDATIVFREVASKYAKYNVTTYMPLWLFTDQYALVVPNTLQDIVVAVFCMLCIACLLIPQPSCALWVAFTIGSIDIGVLGYMTLWGVNLDAISMITIIMSVGFSVDYSAHITYGYVISKYEKPADRMKEALGDLGWPVLQGALSTVLAVIVLADVPAYMIVTFFKTVFLAIAIGLIHGTIFLPLMLSLFVGKRKETKKKQTGNSSMNYKAPTTISAPALYTKGTLARTPARIVPTDTSSYPPSPPILAFNGENSMSSISTVSSTSEFCLADLHTDLPMRHPPPVYAPPPVPRRPVPASRPVLTREPPPLPRRDHPPPPLPNHPPPPTPARTSSGEKSIIRRNL